jgi:hypothetical protein
MRERFENILVEGGIRNIVKEEVFVEWEWG